MPEVLVRGQFEREFIETVIRAWIDNFPEEARTFHNGVANFRRDMHKANGMAKGTDSSSMVLGFVPMRLHVVIGNHIPGFWERPKAREFFFGIYKKAGTRGV